MLCFKLTFLHWSQQYRFSLKGTKQACIHWVVNNIIMIMYILNINYSKALTSFSGGAGGSLLGGLYKYYSQLFMIYQFSLGTYLFPFVPWVLVGLSINSSGHLKFSLTVYPFVYFESKPCHCWLYIHNYNYIPSSGEPPTTWRWLVFFVGHSRWFESIIL